MQVVVGVTGIARDQFPPEVSRRLDFLSAEQLHLKVPFSHEDENKIVSVTGGSGDHRVRTRKAQIPAPLGHPAVVIGSKGGDLELDLKIMMTEEISLTADHKGWEWIVTDGAESVHYRSPLTVRLMPHAVHGVKLFVCRSWFDLARHDPEPVEGSPSTLSKPRAVGGVSNGLTYALLRQTLRSVKQQHLELGHVDIGSPVAMNEGNG